MEKHREQEAEGRSGDERQGDELGEALRSVYDDAVKEDIPSEMLDLLGKLD